MATELNRDALVSRFAWIGGHADIWRWFDEPTTLRAVAAALVEPFRGRATKVAGIESRGFILGTACALELKTGFVPIRKGTAAGARRLIEECGATFLGVAAIVGELPPGRRQQLLHVHTLLPKTLLGDDAEEPAPG